MRVHKSCSIVISIDIAWLCISFTSKAIPFLSKILHLYIFLLSQTPRKSLILENIKLYFFFVLFVFYNLTPVMANCNTWFIQISWHFFIALYIYFCVFGVVLFVEHQSNTTKSNNRSSNIQKSFTDYLLKHKIAHKRITSNMVNKIKINKEESSIKK